MKIKEVTGDDLKFLLDLKEEDIGIKLMQELIANRVIRTEKGIEEKPARFDVQDRLTIPVGGYADNKKPITVNVGKYLFFKLMFEKELNEVIPLEEFADEEKYPAINAGTVNKISDRIIDFMLQGKVVDEKMYVRYIDKLQWHFSISNILNPSFTPKSAKPLDRVEKTKDKLFKKHEKELKDGNTIVSAAIDKELLGIAKEELKGDRGMDIYDSGANASFNNNYRAMYTMKGATMNNGLGKFEIIKSCLSDGMKKEELANHFDSMVEGSYSKGVGVQDAGYLTKKFIAANQSVTMDTKGTDCGTKIALDIKVSKFNMELFIYNYIKENGKYVLLTGENVGNYLGKTISVRLPMHCVNDKTCNRCGGELPYLIGAKNIGLDTFVASGSLLRKSMKKFHDTSIKVSKLDIDNLIL